MKEIKICSLCSRKIKGAGNNPYPFRGKFCCDRCNLESVLPLRLILEKRDRGEVI